MSTPPPRSQGQPPSPARSTHAPVGLRVGRTRAEPDEVVVVAQAVRTDVAGDANSALAGSGRSGPRARYGPMALLEAFVRSDRLVVAALLVLAAALRLPGLVDRGIFDADQGLHMTVLRNLVEHGVFPLLGPETISVKDSFIHHGALYWYLFAPSALLSGADPAAAELETALLGIAAVAATWWAGRIMGGRVVGAIAGLLMAVSPAAVEQSIFLWNPNAIPLFAAIAIGAAWRGHQTGRALWYAIAIGSAVAVYQLHLLGAAFVVGVGFLIAYDVVRAVRSEPDRRRDLARGIAFGVVLTVLQFVPLIVSELQTGFAETRAIVQFLAHGSSVPTTGGLDPLEAYIFIVIRFIGWPFVGQVLDVPVAAVLVIAVWLTLVVWWLVASKGEERLLMAWLLGTVLFATVALDVMAPWLRFVIPGFPTDHYHAFLNPIEFITAGLAGVAFANGAGAIRRNAPRSRGGDAAARVLVGLALLGAIVVAAVRQPPASDVATWPIAKTVGQQVVTLAGGQPIALIGLPSNKSPDSIGYPIVFLGGTVVSDPSQAQWLVVNCDDRFHQLVLKAHCDGGIEDQAAGATLAPLGKAAVLAARIKESDALRISVYQVVPAPPEAPAQP